ncbi:hypothetical protein SprV_0301272100 [Sparganum proliferum]
MERRPSSSKRQRLNKPVPQSGMAVNSSKCVLDAASFGFLGLLVDSVSIHIRLSKFTPPDIRQLDYIFHLTSDSHDVDGTPNDLSDALSLLPIVHIQLSTEADFAGVAAERRHISSP